MRRYYSYPYKAEPLRFPVEPIARKFTVVAIFVCLALVFFNVAAHAVLDPKKLAENELQSLAKDYYENYYYDVFTEQLPESDYLVAFTTYSEYGFPKVYLRELLLFDDSRHADSRPYFEGQYSCNTNRTSVTIIPYAPYGRTDYEVKYDYDCEWQ
ncbi:hypothetical protein IKF94_03735 [Candidatus Saccharibacteria bacterium]|nr:hypothetical protein [Candidatus Saccharibacteria bacterium]